MNTELVLEVGSRSRQVQSSGDAAVVDGESSGKADDSAIATLLKCECTLGLSVSRV